MGKRDEELYLQYTDRLFSDGDFEREYGLDDFYYKGVRYGDGSLINTEHHAMWRYNGLLYRQTMRCASEFEFEKHLLSVMESAGIPRKFYLEDYLNQAKLYEYTNRNQQIN